MPADKPQDLTLYTPLWGEKEIRGFLEWDRAKFFKKLPELKAEGTVFMQRRGWPPRKWLKSYPLLLIRYQMRQGIKGRVL